MKFFTVESLKALYIKNYRVFVDVTGILLENHADTEVIMLDEKTIEDLIAVNAFTKIENFE